MFKGFTDLVTSCSFTVLPRHKENEEFRCSFFPDKDKHREKLPPTLGKALKIKGCTTITENFIVLCRLLMKSDKFMQ